MAEAIKIETLRRREGFELCYAMGSDRSLAKLREKNVVDLQVGMLIK